MDKDTELARMESKMNEYWAEIEDDFLNEEGMKRFENSLRASKMLFVITGCPADDPIPRLIQWAASKLVMRARELDILPEQKGV